MGTIADVVAERAARRKRERKARLREPRRFDLVGTDAGEGFLSRAAGFAGDAFFKVAEGIEFVDQQSRRPLNLLLDAVPGTGPSQGFAPASGEQLAQRLVPGLIGQNREGVAEVRDVPGFLIDLLASPFNLIGLGALSKAGKLAARAGRLKKLTKVAKAKAVRDPGELAGLLKATKQVRSEVVASRRAGKFTRNLPASSLPAQGRAGQRSLLSFDVPFTKINRPLVRGLPVLSGASKAGRAIARKVEPVRALFRPGGRIGRASLKGGDDVDTELFNRLIGEEQNVKRGGKADAIRADLNTTAALQRISSESGGALAETLQTISRVTEPDRLRELAKINKRFVKAERKAIEAGDAQAVANVRASRLKAEARFKSVLAETPKSAAGRTVGRLRFAAESGRRLVGPAAAAARATELNAARQLTALAVESPTAQQFALEIERRTKLVADQAAQRLAAAQATGDARKISQAVGVNTRQSRRLADQLQTLHAQGRISAQTLSRIPAPIAQEARRIGEAMGLALRAEQTAGVRVPSLADPLLRYLPRVLTREARKWVASLKDPANPFHKAVRQFSTTAGFAKTRIEQFRGLTVPQINNLAREFGFKGTFFTEDIGEAILNRLVGGASKRASAGLLDGAAQLFSMPFAKAGVGAMKIEDFIAQANVTRVGRQLGLKKTPAEIRNALKGTQFEGTFISRDIANAAFKLNDVVENASKLEPLLKRIDQANGWYRIAVTQYFPGFHARNASSNLFMMGMAGMKNFPRWLTASTRLQMRVANARAVERGTSELWKFAGRATATELKDFDEMVRLATVGQGFVRDIAGQVAKVGDIPRLRATGRSKVARIGTAIEDNNKIALYLHLKNQGLTSQEAADGVKRWLFDYEDLSEFETRGVLSPRRWAFFYTFARKALPLMIEEVLLNPRKARAIGLATGVSGGRREGRADVLAPWLRERVPFDFGLGSDGKRRFFSLGLPFEELARFGTEGRGPGRAVEKLLSQAAPLPRLILEAATGRDLRQGRKPPSISRRERQTLERLLPDSLVNEPAFAAAFRTLKSSPASRFSGSLLQAFNAPALGGKVKRGESAGQKNFDIFARLLAGVSTFRVDEKRERRQKQIRETERGLQRLADRGKAFEFTRFATDNRLGRRLNRRLTRLRPRRRKTRR